LLYSSKLKADGMASEVTAALRRLVTERANGACEYCQLHQDFSIYTHEVDHVIAMKHGGQTIFENLALACLSCHRYKGSDLTSFDPETGALTQLFNPRSQAWSDHFVVEQERIWAISAVGRTTVALLQFNTPIAVLTRQLRQQAQPE
jgi:HNH endonuclease